MSDNVIYTLSKKFALRIVKLLIICTNRKKNTLCPNNFTDVGQVSVQISQKVFMLRVRQTISVN